MLDFNAAPPLAHAPGGAHNGSRDPLRMDLHARLDAVLMTLLPAGRKRGQKYLVRPKTWMRRRPPLLLAVKLFNSRPEQCRKSSANRPQPHPPLTWLEHVGEASCPSGGHYDRHSTMDEKHKALKLWEGRLGMTA